VSLVWVIVLPIGLLFVLYRNKQQLKDGHNMAVYGFIYTEYK